MNDVKNCPGKTTDKIFEKKTMETCVRTQV